MIWLFKSVDRVTINYRMNQQINDLFEKLKDTLKSRVREAKWAAQEGRDALMAKIDDLKVAVPDISYFTDSKSTYRNTGADKVQRNVLICKENDKKRVRDTLSNDVKKNLVLLTCMKRLH